MSARAHLTSIDTIRVLKAALQQFGHDVGDALVQLELEARRPQEWIENDRARYWPQEVRKASDAVAEARIALERCQVTTSADDQRYCFDERKALEKAKRRLRLAEEKVQAVQKWRVRIKKDVNEFRVHVAKMKRYLDDDLLKAVASLERMAEALDQYAERAAPRAESSGQVSGEPGAPTTGAPA